MKKHLEIEYNNMILRGYLDYASATECAIVVHGIGGNKLGNKYIFRQFADVANSRDLSTVRIDFLGTGESDGSFADTDHAKQSEQLMHIITYVKKTLGFTKVHLVGTSVGCLVILNTLKTFGEDVASVSLWNPNISTEKYRNSTKDYSKGIDMRGLYLNPAYAESMKQIDVAGDYRNYRIAVLHGVKDYNFKVDYVNEFVAENNCAYYEIEDGCHLFESNIAREQLFTNTVDFIQSK